MYTDSSNNCVAVANKVICVGCKSQITLDGLAARIKNPAEPRWRLLVIPSPKQGCPSVKNGGESRRAVKMGALRLGEDTLADLHITRHYVINVAGGI